MSEIGDKCLLKYCRDKEWRKPLPEDLIQLRAKLEAQQEEDEKILGLDDDEDLGFVQTKSSESKKDK